MRNVPTVVGEGVPVAEVDEGGERLDAVALGQLWVLQLHHLDAVQVALVVCRDRFRHHIAVRLRE